MLHEIAERTKRVEEALFLVPRGSPRNALSFMERVNGALIKVERATWVTRAIIWLLPTLAGLGLAAKTIVGFMSRGSSG